LGAIIKDRANFMAVTWISCAYASPPMLAVGINKVYYTAEGIKGQEAFSVNAPSAESIEKTDYCGIISRREQT
jgi:flavin reductase (DIM6/NTAB) family NADH-FMN oxidoreductase RutF